MLGKTRAMFSLRLNFPHCWGKTILDTLPNVPWIMRFFQFVHHPLPSISVRNVALIFSNVSFSILWCFPFMHCWQVHIWIWERDIFQIFMFFIDAALSLIFYLANSSHLVLPEAPVSSQLGESAKIHLGNLCMCHCLGSLIGIAPNLFPPSQGKLWHHSCKELKNLISSIFLSFLFSFPLVVSIGKVHLVSIILSLLEVKLTISDTRT